MLSGYSIYKDIAERTQGDIYIGVVGPVRTGKSTFIKRFMDLLVLPNIENDYKRERAMDELPQSAGGRTITTTEPKFIPNEAVEIKLGDGANFKMRMIDCVGYVVKDALGYMEDDNTRMVMTPWDDKAIPFTEAAEIGTRKVIGEHSTVGIVVTTDGTVCDIDRDEYLEAEARVIDELKEINKPFIVLLNTASPNSEHAKALKLELETKYSVTVLPVSCRDLNTDDINEIMKKILFEFPLKEIGIKVPSWVEALDDEHWLKKNIRDSIHESIKNLFKIKDIKTLISHIENVEHIKKADTENMSLGNGSVYVNIIVADNLFYKVINETSGFEISDDKDLLFLMKHLAKIKRQYDKISAALAEVSQKGYGIVSPTTDELILEEPEIFKQGNRFGVKLKASAPSIHMIRADIETEISPIVGTEKQSEELVHYLLKEFKVDPKKIWESNIFGKSLHELVNEGLHNKLFKMPNDAQEKLQETLQKIINEGSGGLICIIL